MSDILKKEATTIRKVEIKSRNIDPSSDEESKSDRKRKRKKVCSIKRHVLPEVIGRLNSEGFQNFHLRAETITF